MSLLVESVGLHTAITAVGKTAILSSADEHSSEINCSSEGNLSEERTIEFVNICICRHTGR